MKKKTSVFVIATALFVFQACMVTPNRGNSLFGDNPCEVPCWQMILPGETTREEALAILSDSIFVNSGSIEELGSEDLGSIQWSGLPQWNESGDVFVKDGVVQSISIHTDEVNDLSSLIERFGVPEAVSANLLSLPDYPPDWTLSFYYPAQGFSVGNTLGELVTVLSPDTELRWWSLFPVSSLREYIDYRNRLDGLDYEEFEFMPWAGFGEIKQLYPNCRFC